MPACKSRININTFNTRDKTQEYIDQCGTGCHILFSGKPRCWTSYPTVIPTPEGAERQFVLHLHFSGGIFVRCFLIFVFFTPNTLTLTTGVVIGRLIVRLASIYAIAELIKRGDVLKCTLLLPLMEIRITCLNIGITNIWTLPSPLTSYSGVIKTECRDRLISLEYKYFPDEFFAILHK